MRARAIVIALIAAGLASGCTSTSQIGPYVKSVARNGAWLAVQRCMIVLEGNTLAEGECTVEQMPLGTIPPQGRPMQVSPMPASTMPPPAPPRPAPAPVPTR